MKQIFAFILAISLMSFHYDGNTPVITPKLKGISIQSNGYEMSIQEIQKGLELETNNANCEIESYTLTYIPLDGDMLEIACKTTKLNKSNYIWSSANFKVGDLILLENFKIKNCKANFTAKGIFIKII